MKNSRVFSFKFFFFIIIFLRKLRQYICSSICFALKIIYPKMIVRKLLGLLNLRKTQTSYVYKTSKVVVIGKYKNFVLAFF